MRIIAKYSSKLKHLLRPQSCTTAPEVPAPVIFRLRDEELHSHECREDDDEYWELLPGRGSGSTGEARFACRECGREMFRGGWGSELWLDPTCSNYKPPRS